MTIRDYLEFSKRLIFKSAICCERIRYYTSGKIKARDAKLDKIEARIGQIVSEERENPFDMSRDE